MSIIDLISNSARVGGAVLQGYGEDRTQRVKDALAQRKQTADEQREKVLSALSAAQTRHLDAETALLNSGGDFAPAEFTLDGQAVQGFRNKAGQYFTADRKPASGKITPYEKPATVHYSPVVTTAPDGSTQMLGAMNTSTGDVRQTGELAKLTTAGAKLTEPQEKSYLFYRLMEKAQPQIDTAMKSGNVRKLAISTFINAPGALQPVANSQLNADEQALIRSFRDFAAGVLRKESGAAVTHDELREVWGRYGPGFGDEPETDAAKMQSRIDYMNTMKEQAIPAIEFYSKKQQAGVGGTPAAAAAPSASPTREQQLWDAAVQKHGEAKVLRAYGPRP